MNEAAPRPAGREVVDAKGTLSAEGICVSLGGRPVLSDVNVRFERGRVTALLGPNGAGKSTLLACLAGLRKADSGHAVIDGVDVLALDRRARARRIGLLPQNGEVHWDIDVQTLVSLGRLPHRGQWSETSEDAAAVERAMAATDVAQFAPRPARQLSGGERGRVLLARVLAGEPEWLLADEPLASLDPAHQLDGLARLRAVASRGAGVVVVLHDLTHAARIADHVVLLDRGQVVAQGTAEEALDERFLREAFGIEVHVGRASSGERFLIPLRRSGG